MSGLASFLRDTATSLPMLPFAHLTRALTRGGETVNGPFAVFAAGVLALAILVALLILAAMQIRKANHRLGEYAATLEAKNRELKEAREELALVQKLASMGTMAGGVAHEINNPLTVILGYADLLLSPGRIFQPDQKEFHEVMVMISDAARRMKKIVDGFLMFARMTSPDKKPVSINTLLRSTIELVENHLATDNINLVTHLAPGLPEITGNPGQLQQVFVNIITNARHAIREAHDGGTVTISTAAERDRVRVVLTNDGPSIPEEHLNRIFDPLFTTKEPGKGTGLGLSICYGIIKEHGGTLAAKNGNGRGVAFTIDLPRAENTDARHRGKDECSP